MMKLYEAANKSAFQFRHYRAHILLVLVHGKKLLFHRLPQLAEVRSGNGIAHRDQHVLTGLDQEAFVDCNI